MKITLETLRAAGANCEGLDEFAQIFPNGFDGEFCQTMQYLILGTPLRKHLGWAWLHKLLPQWSMAYTNFAGANLREADLFRAQLSDAKFFRADLEEAVMLSTYAEDADFREANCRHANFSGADLVRADFRGADLTGAVFCNANCRDADFRGATMNGVLLDYADFTRAAFSGNINIPSLRHVHL